MSAQGEIAAQPHALSAIPVPLAELFAVAAEHEGNGRFGDAERLLGHILEAAPGQADALHLLGIIACRRGDPERALPLMEASIRHGVNTPLYWRNIGEVYRQLNLLDQALDAGQRACALNPDDAAALSNLAVIQANRMELGEAAASYRRALRFDPRSAGAHFGLAEVLLSQGNMAQGWEEYEWRFQLPQGVGNLPPPAICARQWEGEPLPSGGLLVVADQGFGDCIQFARYLPWVLERCPEPVFAASRTMQPVLRQTGARRLHDAWEQAGGCSAFIPLTGLPRLVGTRLDSIPAPIPYLRPDPARVAAWSARLHRLVPAAHRRVGLAWAGRPEHSNDRRRSTTLASLAPLFGVPGTTFLSLQKGDRQREVGGYVGPAPLFNLAPELSDWDETMAVLSALDVVVTVDTAIAHLAGAIGLKVLLLLPHAAEWRWLERGDTTPWYPNTTLLRQATRGDWDGVARAAAAHLSLATASREPV